MLGGANQKWQQSYSLTLKGANIIIIPDNDKPGQEFAKRIANSLIGYANTIKLLDLTKKWQNLKEKGDITDVFEMVNNDEEVLKKLEELEKETPLFTKIDFKKEKEKKVVQKEMEIKELGIKLKIPENFIFSEESGIKHSKSKSIVDVSPIPILINSILKDVDTGEEKVSLAFLKRNKWEFLIVDKNIICNKNNIVDLANKGIPVVSSTSNELVNWLYSLEITNYDNLPVEKTVKRFGWINDCTEFVPYKCFNVKLDAEKGIMTWLEKYLITEGNIDSWSSNIKEFLLDDERQIIRFLIASGFSSSLLRILKLRGTIINIYGPSGIGKTGLLELVCSIFSTPDNIITFAATPISITILSERLNSIGMIIDDKQTAFNSDKIGALIYSLAEGRTRLKATKESDLIENRKFEINVITSGEEPLNENAKHTRFI